MTVVRAAIGLGSNVGDREAHLTSAVEALRRLGDVRAVSALYETAPIGGPSQGPYLNGVALVDTELPPGRLLDEMLAIERSLGRERGERWAPRTIDLDLLLYGDQRIAQPGLAVPHPRISERRFVLEPLLEVWPDAALPDGGRVAELLSAVADQQVRRLDRVGESTTTDLEEFHPAAAWIIFFTVGLGAAAIWWIIDWIL